MTHWSTWASSHVWSSHAIELLWISFHTFLRNSDVSVCIFPLSSNVHTSDVAIRHSSKVLYQSLKHTWYSTVLTNIVETVYDIMLIGTSIYYILLSSSKGTICNTYYHDITHCFNPVYLEGTPVKSVSELTALIRFYWCSCRVWLIPCNTV